MKRALPRLHAITDERIARRVDLDDILDAFAGVDMAAHARGHTLSGREHYELSVRLTATARKSFRARPPVRPPQVRRHIGSRGLHWNEYPGCQRLVGFPEVNQPPIEVE